MMHSDSRTGTSCLDVYGPCLLDDHGCGFETASWWCYSVQRGTDICYAAMLLDCYSVQRETSFVVVMETGDGVAAMAIFEEAAAELGSAPDHHNVGHCGSISSRERVGSRVDVYRTTARVLRSEADLNLFYGDRRHERACSRLKLIAETDSVNPVLMEAHHGTVALSPYASETQTAAGVSAQG